MALDTAPKLTRRRNVAFDLETTNGTAVSLAASNGVTHVFGPSMAFETEEVERDSQGSSFSPIATAKGARSARFTFETEATGNGGAGQPDWGKLLKGCGFTESGGIYTAVTGATQPLTMGLYTSGLLKTMAGAMGTFTLTLRRGQKARFAWDFMGVQAPPTDTANIAPTYVSAAVAPRVGATTFTIGGTTFRVPEVTIECGNVVVLREDISALDSASEPTGYRCAMITARRTIVRISPEALPLATKDWYDAYRDSTLGALICDWGADANNIFQVDMPKLQLISNPVDEDRGGLLAHQLTFLATRSAAAGDDDFLLTLA
jgi:hypothetical protein